MHGRLGIFLLIRNTNTGDIEELQEVVVERSDATVLLVIKSRSVPSMGRKPAQKVSCESDQLSGGVFWKGSLWWR